jgi:arylsulfatase A-like enzyme
MRLLQLMGFLASSLVTLFTSPLAQPVPVWRVWRNYWLVAGFLATASLPTAAVTITTPAPNGPKSPTRPNIVVLLADDWGFTDVGAFGGEMATPNIDALARRGVRFSNFHASASCSPTRAMLLTGVDNHRNGVGNMRETIPREHLGRPGYLTVLDRNVVTVASRLQAAGYRTYATGKWHVGQESYNLPSARGFDHSLIQADSGSDNWETGQRYLGLTDQVNWYEDGRPAKLPEDYYSSQFFVDRLLGYLRDAAGTPQAAQPFFAYVGFQANHLPVQAPAAFRDRYRGRYAAGWEAVRAERTRRAAELGVLPPAVALGHTPTAPAWNSLDAADQAFAARNMEVYAGMAEAMDHHVGRLVDYLRAAGQLDNTVFVFLSDNGPEGSDPYDQAAGWLWLATQYSRNAERLGEKGTYGVIGPGWATAAAGPLAGYKFYGTEGGIRVPLIIAGVPGIVPGSVQPAFTRVMDVAPTLLELAQLPVTVKEWQGRAVESVGGRSLLPLLQGEAERVYGKDEPVGFELSGNAALYKGDYKLVKVLPPMGDGRWHLYDLPRDPGETRDLTAVMPDKFRELQADYAAYARTHGVLPMPAGYEATQQVMMNAWLNVYWPATKRVLPGIIIGLLVGLGGWWFVRRRRRALPAG